LETAISLYLESGASSVPPTVSPTINKNQMNLDDDDVQIIGESIRHRIRSPIQPRRDMLSSLPEPSFRNSFQESRSIQTNPADKVWEHNDRLASLFEPPFDIMFQGTFEMVHEFMI
jgi:hypothetical protein